MSESDQKTTVTCATCGTEFPVMGNFEKHRQAYRCSATVTDEGITGHYGSTVIDMEFWAFKNGRPSEVGLGDVCDDCVQKLMDAGTIELERGGIW